jgi:CopG family transcriptional regulator, nickel-responsive regulator
MHVRLDHENCLEVALPCAGASAVREYAKEAAGGRGVKHGQVSYAPIESQAHGHGGDPLKRVHAHPGQ